MSAYFNIAKKLASGVGQAINKVKTKVNKTKLDKANSKLNIAIQKNKASKAKLGQTIFEMENPKFKGKDFTFKGNKGRSLKQSDKKKKIISDNNKVIGRMFKKAIEGKKDGGRMGLKGGGNDMGSNLNQNINSLKNFLEDRKNRKKSKIPTGTYAYMKRDRSPKEVDRVMSKLKSDAQAMGGDFKSVSELKPLKGESKKSFKSRPSTKFFNKGGRAGLKKGSFPDHSGDGKITKKDILMAKGVIPKSKSKKKII